MDAFVARNDDDVEIVSAYTRTREHFAIGNRWCA